MDFLSTVKGSMLEGFYPAGWDMAKIDACCDKGVVNERGNPHQDFSVKRSDIPPGKNVIRFNKPYYKTGVIPHDTVSCYDCKKRGDSFCRFFADSRFDCTRRSECPCNECCMRLMDR